MDDKVFLCRKQLSAQNLPTFNPFRFSFRHLLAQSIGNQLYQPSSFMVSRSILSECQAIAYQTIPVHYSKL